MSRRNYVIVLASVYVVSAIAIGNPASAPLDPNVLASEIRSRGAKVVADGLGDQEWLRVQKGVETGAQPWLRVASALHKATDAGISESLSLAAGVALVRAPRDVLMITADDFSVEAVCGYPDMSDARTNTQAKVVQYLDERIAAVSKIGGADARDLANKCLAELKKTKHDVTGPDNPFSRPRER